MTALDDVPGPGPGATEHPAPGVTRTLLPGGLRVVTEQVVGARSVSLGLWVDVGSRDETFAGGSEHSAGSAELGTSQHGAAHFLEHLLFKGTRRRSARAIAEEIDAVGGDLNAFTGKEHTCFYAHVLDADMPLATDVLCDVVLEARMDAADVEIERDVILSEIAGRDEDPEDLLADDFDALVLDGHPLALPVIGSEESVTAMNRATLVDFHATHYRPERAVIAAAGNVDHAAVVAAVTAAYGERLGDGHLGGEVPTGGSLPVAAAAPGGSLPVAAAARRAVGTPAVTSSGSGRLSVREEDTEQAHVMIGGPGLRRGDPRWEAQLVLSTVLGGGMSSRLFQQIREQRGLAYSVYSSTTGYSDRGTLAVYVGCAPERLGQAAAVLRDELAGLAAEGITDAELARARGQLRGELVLGLEDTPARMSRLGRRELDHGAPVDVAESLRRIDAVSVADVAELATELLSGPRAVAVVGPYRDADELPGELREMGE